MTHLSAMLRAKFLSVQGTHRVIENPTTNRRDMSLSEL
jgi:hypothetical protein